MEGSVASQRAVHSRSNQQPRDTRVTHEAIGICVEELNHLVWWNNYLSESIHEDRHPRFQYLQATFNIPKQYENPVEWLPRHLRDPEHCLTHRCVSVWWYHDQAMRDIPGFGENKKSTSAGMNTNQHNNQPNLQPPWVIQHNQHNQPPQYSTIQENIAEAAAVQRQLSLHHHAPEPHEDMDDLDSWDIHYDGMMPPEQRSMITDMEREIKRIKQRHQSKVYIDRRTNIINKAEAARQLDRNSPQIPHFLFSVKTPWSPGYGQANDAYDQDKIYGYEQRIAQLRNTNARLCQMPNGNFLLSAWAYWSRRPLSYLHSTSVPRTTRSFFNTFTFNSKLFHLHSNQFNLSFSLPYLRIQ